MSSAVKNFMNGNSYEHSPLTTLKIVAASSIFGEGNYYISDNKNQIQNLIECLKSPYMSFIGSENTVEDIMEKAIDNSLDADFKGTLDYALELRNGYNMRLNPQVIFTRACLHKNRVEFDKQFPGYLRNIGRQVSPRPDDVVWQFQYFGNIKGGHKQIPNIMKRVWTDKLSKLTPYQIAKYKTIAGRKELINVARLANTRKIRLANKAFNEYMEKGTFEVSTEEQTWEKYISENGNSAKSWEYVLDHLFQRNGKPSNHMALLRNLRNIENADVDTKHLNLAKSLLKAGVKEGKQFPFRYYTALNVTSSFKNTLEECIELAVDTLPALEGDTICLCDNSGSAWGAFTSEYGQVTVATIANLSSVITARGTKGKGKVGIFGDDYKEVDVDHGAKIFDVLKTVEKIGQGIGGGTETGLWTFWNNALKNKIHYDNIFIYSDMQAGHKELYRHHKGNNDFYDTVALIREYREQVNAKVNVFSVQVAGYNNTILPELSYRVGILSGWTGKESLYAAEMIKLWDETDK
jgi:hypothetical protein